ncbi:MAG: phosphoadenylyl-sulfate reductase [Parvularculaceae bacterium]
MSASVIALRRPDTDEDALDGDLESRARRLAMRAADTGALDILRIAIKEEFPGRVALVSSFGAESAALLHLVAVVDRSTPVIFLETGKHFAQTLSHRKKLTNWLGLRDVREIRPDPATLAERDREGDLWRHDADACCTLRKVKPLNTALSGFDAWITGRKQFHGGQRVRLPVFEASGAHIKVNPIVDWSKDDVDIYIRDLGLPAHPLIAHGYPSIGCWPCTHPVAQGEDTRAGRWRGAAKTECGIHRMA